MNLAPDHLDALFQALGDSTRRAVLERLSKGPATVSEIAEPFDMTLPAVMVHLHRLEAAGLVVSEKTGRVRTLALAADSYTPVRDWLDQQRAAWEARLDRMERFALDQKPNRGTEK
jgi:DNA-binding transcriptional ArsR family regulator